MQEMEFKASQFFENYLEENALEQSIKMHKCKFFSLGRKLHIQLFI